jgi:hypothetical protein
LKKRPLSRDSKHRKLLRLSVAADSGLRYGIGFSARIVADTSNGGLMKHILSNGRDKDFVANAVTRLSTQSRALYLAAPYFTYPD